MYDPTCTFSEGKSCLNRFHNKDINYLQPHTDPRHLPELAWQPGGPLPPVSSTKMGRYVNT